MLHFLLDVNHLCLVFCLITHLPHKTKSADMIIHQRDVNRGSELCGLHAQACRQTHSPTKIKA